MPVSRMRRALVWALTLAVLSLVAAGCGGDNSDNDAPGSEPAVTTTGASGASGVTSPADGEAGEGRAPESADDEREPAPDDVIGERPGAGGDEDPGPATREPSAAQERQLEAVVRAYLAALRSRDGMALCREIFEPGALRLLRLPVRRGSCAASVSASIGHHRQPGAPRWLGARLVDARTVILAEDGKGRVTGTVANRVSSDKRRWIEDVRDQTPDRAD